MKSPAADVLPAQTVGMYHYHSKPFVQRPGSCRGRAGAREACRKSICIIVVDQRCAAQKERLY